MPDAKDTKSVGILLNETRKGHLKWKLVPSGAPVFNEFSADHLACREALGCTVRAPDGGTAQAIVARVGIGHWDEELERRYWSNEHFVYLCDSDGRVIKLLSVPEQVTDQLFDEARLSARSYSLSVFEAFVAEHDEKKKP